MRTRQEGQSPPNGWIRSASLRRRRSRAVSPGSFEHENGKVLEIRPGRWLRIRHLQPPGKHKSGEDATGSQGDLSCTPGSAGKSEGRVSEGSITVNTTSDADIGVERATQMDFFPRLISGRHEGADENDSPINSRTATLGGEARGAKPLKETDKVGGSETYSNIIKNTESGHYTQNRTSETESPVMHAARKRRNSKWSSQVSLVSLMEEPGTVLFFIHGVGGCGEVWRHQVDYFQQAGFEVVVPDMLGHGFSRAPRQASAYSFEELAADMLAVFDRYSKKRNVLIGHSYGGSFCTLIARVRPRKVTKLILISNGGPIPLSPQPCQLFCLPSCCLACIKPVINQTFARQAFHKGGNLKPHDLQHAFDVPAYVLRGTMQGQFWPEGDSNYHAALSVAVLLIHGSQDEFVTREESELMKETIYASQLELIESAGHMVMVEQPRKVNELIHAFILKDMTIVRALQSQVTDHMTSRQQERAFSPSPVMRHKTVPNFSIT